MDFKSIQEILRFVNKSDLTEVEIEQKDFKLRVCRQQPEVHVMQSPYANAPASYAAMAPVALPAAASADANGSAEPAAPAENKNLFEFKSPIIGTFYRASGPDKDAFAKVGDVIRKGQVVCIIEAMKLFNEIESDVEGKVVKILVENAQPVEYDQPLFLVELA